MDWHEAVAIAARAHGQQRDRSGILELAHAIEVASALGEGASADELAAAALHDVLEDTDWTADDLAAAGVPAVVIEAVEHVSRIEEPQQETYRAFIARTATAEGEAGRIARRVKLADVLTNMERIRSLPEGEGMRRKRYLPALETIRGAMRENGELELDSK
jgi:GTP diphosphokinase / guanosine-3',5'-bis(diphosphate) 3'-diphosphatase